MILKTLGWIFVIWLLCSTIYSTIFHLSNYLFRKQKIKNEEVDELYIILHKRMSGNLIFTQLAKITIMIIMLYFLLK